MANSIAEKSMKNIFTETGHATLKAYLTISSGATIAFLALIAQVFTKSDVIKAIGAPAAHSLLEALQFFGIAVLLSAVGYGASFISHAFYFRGRSEHGLRATYIVALFLLTSLGSVAVGGYHALNGFRVGVENVVQQSKTAVNQP